MRDLKSLDKRYRPEIEGLRVVASLLVVTYHIWFGRVSGGIDIFYVIAGFLVTLSLISRIERNGQMRLGNYFAGLGRRLLPQALIVIVFVMIVGYFVLPTSQLNNLKAHFIASVFYFENWRLAFDAVDYLASGLIASPFQHFWSLGVQGQIYIIWPILFTIGYYVLTKVCKVPLRIAVLTMLTIVVAVSLTYSIYKTNTNQPWAYFDTFARLWEFAIGGMLAILLPYLRLPKSLSWVLGWVGLIIISLTGVVLQVSTVFPGYMALVPLGGAALILVAADNNRKGVGQLLSMKWLTALGGVSYGIYLWHWPLLRFYEEYFVVEEVKFFPGLAIILLTFILSFLTTNLIEKPIRDRKLGKFKPFIYSAGFSTVLAVGVVFSTYIVYSTNQTGTLGKEYPGALVMDGSATAPKVDSYLPSFAEITTDLPSFYSQTDCIALGGSKVESCNYGKVDNPKYTIALVGGSHSGHWFPALEELSNELDFQIKLYNRDSCRFTLKADDGQDLKETCYTWNENVLEELKADPPDLIFTIGTIYGEKNTSIPQGFINMWKELENDTTIFALRDTPFAVNVPTLCLERSDNPDDCAIPKQLALPDLNDFENTKGLPENVVLGDLSQYFCDDEKCPVVIGNVIVYRDDDHITTYYSRSLAPKLKPLLENALEVAAKSKSQRQKNVSS